MALSLALGGGAWSSGFIDQTPSLPELPRLAFESFLPAVRAVVQKAYAAAVANPRDASANGKLGMVLHANSHFEEAGVCYRRARLLDRASFRWAYFLGLVQAGRGNCREAAATLRAALRLDPEYLPAQLKLGECLLGSGSWQEAAELYEAILAKHADSAEVYYGLGRVQAVRKDLDGAVGSLRKACELFPNFGAAHYALAHAYKRLGKTDQSLEQLNLFDRDKTSAPVAGDLLLDDIRALNLNPLDQMRMGMELAREGKLEEAIAAHEKALESDPQLVKAHVNLIVLYGRLGQSAKAEEHFEAAMRLDPNEPENYFNHGLLLASQSGFLEAEGAFRKTLEINPLYPDARTNLGAMLEAQGKLSEAIAEYQQALENNPDDPRAHFSLGRILVNQENYQEGIQHLLKSLSAGDEESKPSYLYALGAAYARSGDRENGLRYLRMAREEAAVRGQSKLVENIDEDLKLLKEQGPPE